MPFTVSEFHDFIRILEMHPEWRADLLRVLFPEALLDLPRVVQELAEAQRQTEAAIRQLTERMERGFAEAAADRQRIWEAMERGFAEAAADRQRIWEAIREITERMERGFAEAAADRQAMRHDIGRLKGLSKEQYYRDRAAAIFGPLLRGGRDATQQVVEQLRLALEAGRITAQEYRGVLDADLLWSGRLWETDEEVLLVLEASWMVQARDVERAAQRAAILRRAGVRALPVAAGEEWPVEVQRQALQERVVMVQDGLVDETSWEAALVQP